MNSLKFTPISGNNIEEALKLTDFVFPHDLEGQHSPRQVFLSYIHPEKYKEYRKRRKVLEYFAVYDNSGKIIGITGYYRRDWDKKGTIWLGWFGIDKKERGKGYGKEILMWTSDKVKNEGYNELKLWTTTDSDEAVAQILYEKLGFKIISKGKRKGQEYQVLYRAKNL